MASYPDKPFVKRVVGTIYTPTPLPGPWMCGYQAPDGMPTLAFHATWAEAMLCLRRVLRGDA